MKVVCMIPARYNSSRYDGKALADLNGKPMIQHVYEGVKEYTGADWIGVVTDDDRIYCAVKEFNGNIIMTSPECRTGTDRVAEAAAALYLEDDDIVVNIQGDQPRINKSHIEQVVSVLQDNTLYPVASLAYKIKQIREIVDVNTVKVTLGHDLQAIYFSRCSIPYRKNGNGPDYYKHLGIYAYRAWFLRQFALMETGELEQSESLEQLRILENGHQIKMGVTLIDSPSVDTPEDMMQVQDIIADCGGCCG